MTPEEWKNFPHFKQQEFMCPCCGKEDMQPSTILLLEYIRNRINRPIQILSGYRCKKHNAEVGGVPNSAHTKGLAADILISDDEYRMKLLQAAILLRVKRIGIGKTFIHLDICVTLPYPRIWVYNNK